MALFKKNKQAQESSSEYLAYATVGSGKQKLRIGLAEGRHLIGGSTFCKIPTDTGINSIAGAIVLTPKSTTLKCLSNHPGMFVDGNRLKPGETIVIGDVIEFIVGTTTVMVSAGSKTPMTIAAKRKELDALAESSSPDQSAIDLAIGDIDKLRQRLARKLLDQMNMEELDLGSICSPEVREKARLKLRRIVSGIKLPEDYQFSKEEIEQQVYDEVMGLGPIEPLLANEKVTEIMVNRRDQIYIEEGGKLKLSKVSFSSDQSLLHVIERIVSTVGRRIDTSSPIVDARLVDGSRVNAIIPPLALNGPCLTIRRFSKTPISVKQLVKWDAVTEQMSKFLDLCVKERKNIMISGGTGSGKTTLLNALSSFIPGNERLVTIEDAAELQLQQKHVIRMETRPANLEGAGAISIRDLVKNTLRMRPDRIIVGECRGAEALDMLQAMNTGHDGSMTTAHANSPEDMLRRLETMVMMAGMDLPLRAIREQIVSALTVVVQQTRRKDGRRLVTDVSWIRSLDRSTGEYEVIPLMTRSKHNTLTTHDVNLRKFWKEEELEGDLKSIETE